MRQPSRSHPGGEGSDLIVIVKDNGIGFAEEYAERVFGLFKSGTGLGLAICQRIVESLKK